MFRKWLENNNVDDFSFDGKLFPKANEREFWDDKYKESYIKEAEKYIDFSWPIARATDFMAFKVTGNRLLQEDPYFKRREALFALMRAELVEYKGRFLPDILNGIFAILEETYWGVSAHFKHKSTAERIYDNIPDSQNDYIDLFAAETGSAISIWYYLFYDEFKEFCPEILRYAEYELDRRIIKPYLEHKDFWWMGYDQDVNNWNGWIIANVLTVFLLVEKDEAKIKKAVKKMIYEINRLYDRLPDDGGCDEGASYWTVSGGMMFEFAEQLYVATSGGIDLFYDKKLQDIFLYEYKAYIGEGKFVNFADGTSTATGIHGILYMMGERLNNAKIKAFAKELMEVYTYVPLREIKVRRGIYNMMYEDSISKSDAFIQEDDVFLDKLQVSASRNDEWYYAIKGGDNDEGHNHNDIGSFIVYYKNHPVLCDPGCGVYTRQTFGPERYTIWTMRSDWHNLPVINDTVQKQGREHAATKFIKDGRTTVVDFEKAYPENANIKKAERIIAFNADGIELTDEYVFTQEKNTVSEHFVTPCNVEIVGNSAVIDGKYILECDTECEITKDLVEFKGDNKLVSMWQTDSMKRIMFNFSTEERKKIKFILRRI